MLAGSVNGLSLFIYRLVNGDVFRGLFQWPSWAEGTFWKKPMTDEECFKMMRFFFAKGLDPCLPATWVPQH